MSPDRSDEDLVKDAQNGSDQAFELLMRRHSGNVRSLIARFCSSFSMVDDLAQETFVKAFFKMNTYRGDSPFVFWLRKQARPEIDRKMQEAQRRIREILTPEQQEQFDQIIKQDRPPFDRPFRP